jgi:putative DNA methylase
MTVTHKKLIEVALPLDVINAEALRRKQKAPKGWPTSFHKWWAQRPLAAARAVIFAQMVDDPSEHRSEFPTEEDQQRERERLFGIITNIVQWDNTANPQVLQEAREEIWKNWRRICSENAGHQLAKELFDSDHLPPFWDPFAGSGSLPLSAQWLGIETYASDLNPVAVLINKALIEIPFKFARRPPVNPEATADKRMFSVAWHGAQGLAQDVRYYGKWMRDEAENRIGYLYPQVQITAEMAQERSDLKPLVGRRLKAIAWIWARTVKSPDPAYAGVDVPLASTFVLSTKKGKEAWVEPRIENGSYYFTVRVGEPKDRDAAKRGTKSGGSGTSFFCLMSGAPIPFDYVRAEAKAGRMGARMMAIVAEGDRGRVYLAPTTEHELSALGAQSTEAPETDLPAKALGFRVQEYGMTKWRDLFTERQLVALTTFSDLASEAKERIRLDAIAAGMADDGKPLRDGTGARAYAEAISTYLACVVDRMVYYGSTLVGWLPKDSALGPSMPRQTVSMTWDFVEGNPLGKSSGDATTCSNAVANYLTVATPFASARAIQADAQAGLESRQGLVISTDPPYYDNVAYADLSDYFYVWLRRRLRTVFPDLFATLATPKAHELVASPYLHGSKENAESFFLDGMTRAMNRISEQGHPAFPITIYYAFKQVEDSGDEGTASTGWETFLGAVIASGLTVSGTWPLRTEGEGRMRSMNSNALATSIVLVCRPRAADAPTATRREFITALKAELPVALAHLQRGNIAPVDLAQAAIGPGMAVYTRHANVLDAEGKALSVREALALINQTLDEALAEQEGDFDADSRWALAWFEQAGFGEGDYGVAETLSKAKNTSVSRMVEAGILASGHGKVRLHTPSEMRGDWDPTTDRHRNDWEVVHQLIRALERGGEGTAAQLAAKLGDKAETARELAYRLYTVCERKKRAAEALSYNALVQSWPEISRLAREGGPTRADQAGLFLEV